MVHLLSEIKNQAAVKVIQILSKDLQAKFAEMGLIEGKELKWLFQAPFKDPIAIEVDGYILSLRKDEAKFIEVEFI
jgi:ferrous iron transport protein A